MSSTARAPSVARAIADGLGLAAGRVLVVRGARIDLALPPGCVEVGEADAADALLAAIDAESLESAVARASGLPADRALAWVMPVARPGLVGWALSRARRLSPLALEDVCDALRRIGVVEVRVTEIDGRLPLVVVTGHTTAA